jgi:alpha-1,2-mannosyltransferase
MAVFVVVNLGNALHKGGDFRVSLEAGHRFLTAMPLYEGSTPGLGVTGPPFQSVWFSPFAAIAAIHVVLSRVLWYLANVICLLGGVWCWTQALLPGRFKTARVLWGAPEVLLPLLAIALPTQTNFEHQNMNALLLFLTGVGALAVVHRADIKAGGFLGAAVALKAFPLLLLGALVVRRSWRVAAAGAAFAVGLTSLVVVRYGLAGGFRTFQDWLAISVNGGWPTRPQNQSLFAALTRLWPGDPAIAHTVGWCILVGLAVVVSWKRRNLPPESAGSEIAFVLAVAVVLSPIAWEHYWVLMFPILQVAYTERRRTVFWVAVLLITGPSPLLVGETGYDLARTYASSTIAALLLIGAMTPILLRSPRMTRIS